MSAVAKVFQNGRSQAIRIPKEYRVDTDEVYVDKVDGKLIITPKVGDKFDKMKDILKSFDEFSDEELDIKVDDLELKSEEIF
jgi:antitoxin VapB